MKYYFRLDDACEHLDIEKWNKVEAIFDKFNIDPLVGIIPNCGDPNLLTYKKNDGFWKKAKEWETKGWIIALHGYSHIYDTKSGGINPVHSRSEFAGKSKEIQGNLVKEGLAILNKNDLKPKVFFAPSHTFDLNTIKALLEYSDIRIISDTIASQRYGYKNITFIPQQLGRVKKVKIFKEITICLHPNNMTDSDFCEMERFISKNHHKIYGFDCSLSTRRKSLYDRLLTKLYFLKRKLHGSR